MIGALELGGSHVSAGAVDVGGARVHGLARHALDAGAGWDDLLARLVAAASPLRDLVDRWAVAIPGPFDTVRGIGGAHPGGKFAAFAGRDLSAALAGPLGGRPVWVNDAQAFGLGRAAALGDAPRLAALTLGSGIGSAFVAGGRALTGGPGVPDGGEVYGLPYDGAGAPGAGGAATTIEGALGPAAIVSDHPAYADFRALCDAARSDRRLADDLSARFAALGDALAPWWAAFGPDVVAVGGSVCGSWDLFGEAFEQRVRAACGPVRIDVATDTERSALLGAAYAAAGRSRT